MLPPTSTRLPSAAIIRPSSVVVVDFPFVPVTAITRPRSHRDASSTSPMTSTPRARAETRPGSSGGTPGLVTTRSAESKVAALWPPSSTLDARVPSAQTPARSPRVVQSSTPAPLAGEAVPPLQCRFALLRQPPLAAREPKSRHLPHHHRSFNVVRLKSAKITATIRNRVMTFGSLQPRSSK